MSLSYNDSLCVAVKQRWFCADVLPIVSQPEQCDLPSALIKLQSRRKCAAFGPFSSSTS